MQERCWYDPSQQQFRLAPIARAIAALTDRVNLFQTTNRKASRSKKIAELFLLVQPTIIKDGVLTRKKPKITVRNVKYA